MNLVKRVYLVLIRNKKKSLSTFLIIFLLCNLIASSYAIMLSTNTVKNEIKESLSGIITIHADEEMSYFERSNWKECYKITDLIDSYANNNSDISYMDYSFESMSYIKGVKDIEFDEALAREIYAVSNENFEHLNEGNINIVEGRTFTKEEIDNGSNVIIVNKWIFESYDDLNIKDLEIGDKILLSNVIYEYEPKGNNKFIQKEFCHEDEEYEIIGFYTLASETDNNNFWPDIDGTYAEKMIQYIYMPLKSAESLMDEYRELYQKVSVSYPNKSFLNYGGYLDIKSMIIKPTSPDSLDTIKDDIIDLYKQNNYEDISVFTSNNAYELIAGPIESLGEISSLVIKISFIASVTILSLIILLSLRDRKHEIGLYLSLGEKKSKIIFQIFLETYVIGMLAVSLSLSSGLWIGQKIADQALETTTQSHMELYGDELEKLESVNSDYLTITDISKNMKIEYSTTYILSLYVTSTLIISLSIIGPMLYLTKLNPKKILL